MMQKYKSLTFPRECGIITLDRRQDMSQFTRELSEELQGKLENEELYKSKLYDDVKAGKVFPAVRGNTIDFYYKGGKLFGFGKEGFKTHIKYASVFKPKGHYITESNLKSLQTIRDFTEGYGRIKENCALYSGVEAAGVSNIYHKYSYAKEQQTHDTVLLDIEVCFAESADNEKFLDRIDILLFNKNEGLLRFYEAKHYSNPELWGKAKVIKQISRYETQIINSKDRIITQYRQYIEIVNTLFGAKLPTDKLDIAPKVTLLVFGYDRDQLNSIQNNLTQNCIPNHYLIGNIKALNIDNLWNKTTC
jgi:hypothetical protein